MLDLTRKSNVVFFVLLVSILSGCATQLAPLYDKAIVDGITSVNKDAMILFASMSGGTSKESFQGRAALYDNIIGSIDALELQAKARPAPKTKTVDAVNKWLESRGIRSIGDDGVPSAVALKNTSVTIAKMRDVDRKQGVTPYEVLAFKGQTSIYMDQAITYEAFLER